MIFPVFRVSSVLCVVEMWSHFAEGPWRRLYKMKRLAPRALAACVDVGSTGSTGGGMLNSELHDILEGPALMVRCCSAT